METSDTRPTPDEASAALLAAGSARYELSHRLTTPSWFYTSIGVVIVIQTAALAVGVALQSLAGIGLAVAGLVPFALVAWLQAAFYERWWLVALCAVAAGVAYALSGALWMRSYRRDPAANSRGESIVVVVAVIVVLLAAAVMLILQSTH
jgi:hypothetical protein